MDISTLLFEAKSLPERAFFYYLGHHLTACRTGEWKAHFHTQIGFGPSETRHQHDPPLLFYLGRDPSEKRSVTEQHPEVLAALQAAVEAHRAGITPGTPQR